jgi:hypothetical protein
MQNTTKELQTALSAALGKKVMYVKGSFCVNTEPDCTWVSIAQARKITGLKAPERNERVRVSAYGDYATIAQINRIRL